MMEKDVQVKFGTWIKDNQYDHSAAFELKLCKGNNALSYSAFEPQQIPCLLKAKQSFIYKKLSDADRTLKPFDCLVLAHAEAWVVACWHHEGKGVTAYWIDVETFIETERLSERKSMTELIAKKISFKIIHL